MFDCAFRAANGTRSIHYQGHIRMMAAAQPFISGAISKTVNLPPECTIEDVQDAYMESWKQGLKAVAIYRDGCKRTQPLSTSKTDPGLGKSAAAVAAAPVKNGPPAAVRKKLPDERQSLTHKFSIAGHEGYIHVGLYETGEPGEIFVKMAKEGSTISGLMDSFATAISLALQHGVPLRLLCDKFSRTRFEPYGFTENPEIPRASSIMDYLFRWLASKFVKQDAPVIEAAAAPPPTEEIQRVAEVVAAAQKVEVGRRRPHAPRRATATPTATSNGNGSSAHRQRQLQLHRPHRRADLPRMRIDHDPQRQLPQVRQLRHDQRLLVVGSDVAAPPLSPLRGERVRVRGRDLKRATASEPEEWRADTVLTG